MVPPLIDHPLGQTELCGIKNKRVYMLLKNDPGCAVSYTRQTAPFIMSSDTHSMLLYDVIFSHETRLLFYFEVQYSVYNMCRQGGGRKYVIKQQKDWVQNSLVVIIFLTAGHVICYLAYRIRNIIYILRIYQTPIISCTILLYTAGSTHTYAPGTM